MVAGTKDTGRTSKLQFLQIVSKTKLVTYRFNCFVGKPPKFFNFSSNMTKRLFSRYNVVSKKASYFYPQKIILPNASTVFEVATGC